jgi:hypothetical protein
MIPVSHCAKNGQVFLPGNPAAGFRWHGLRARLHGAIQAAIAAHLPLGYEDETGFHFGVETRWVGQKGVGAEAMQIPTFKQEAARSAEAMEPSGSNR